MSRFHHVLMSQGAMNNVFTSRVIKPYGFLVEENRKVLSFRSSQRVSYEQHTSARLLEIMHKRLHIVFTFSKSCGNISIQI